MVLLNNGDCEDYRDPFNCRRFTIDGPYRHYVLLVGGIWVKTGTSGTVTDGTPRTFVLQGVLGADG